MPRLGRTAGRTGFWLTVAGVAILAPFALQMAADKLPLVGLKRFVGYIYREGQA